MSNKTKEELEYPAILICSCSSEEHQIIIRYDHDDKLAYVHTHLFNSRNFFSRLWHGLKYITGYHCRYGHWDEFILDERHAPKLKELAELLSQEKTK